MPEEMGVEELHYSADELAAYFSGEMSDDEAELVETHLGRCDACKAKTEHVGEKSEAWFSWTPQVHREALAASAAPKAERKKAMSLGFLEALHWRPQLRILIGVAAAVLVLLAIWTLTSRGPERPPERAKQVPPAPAPIQKKEPGTEQAVTPPPAIRPVVAVFLLPGAVRSTRSQQTASEVLVPPGGCTIRLDVRPGDLGYARFAAIIQNPDTGVSFPANRVTIGKAADAKPAVQVFFSSNRVRSGEYVLRLSGGPAVGNLEEVEVYVFTVTKSTEPKPRK